MAISKLTLYNNALLLVGERQLASDTEDREPRHLLDTVYDQAATKYCMELTKPKFALAAVTLPVTTTRTEGLLNVYDLPADYISIFRVFSDVSLDQPIHRYIIEGRTLSCDVPTPIYLRYVTSSVELTFNTWTPTFANVVSAFLAKEIAPRIAPQKLKNLEELFSTRVQVAIELEGVKEEHPRPAKSTFTLTDDLRKVYNQAFIELGLDEITSNADDSNRRAKADILIGNKLVKYCLELVKPKFALDTDTLTVGSTRPEGLTQVYNLPATYISIYNVFSDAAMDQPIHRYIIEGRTLSCDIANTIYLRYISSSFETTYANWTPTFNNVVSAYIAKELAPNFAPDKVDSLEKLFMGRVKIAIELEGVKEEHVRPTKATATLTDSWRKIYNQAFLGLGFDEITSNTDDSNRRAKADVAIGTGLVATVLEDYGWQFALVNSKVEANPALEPQWGLIEVFEHPIDLHRIDGIFHDEFLRHPLREYEDTDNKWFANVSPIYIKYVSTNFLVNPDSWPQYFKNLVAAHLARMIGPSLKGANLKAAMEMFDERDAEAASTDAMRTPPQRIGTGDWTRSRRSYGRSDYNDRP